ncbi:branched-chain amino acid ABC transporter permease [Pacificispira sp.]|uniref:branched-chain amino acid ABC transporter permease n=1 Tax=Pacificispira sp. TaxID=2888761 RepID=UPI002EA58EED|nr:branched-chain amino acid ABC transporter permease [Pseudomonadota bacterium]
MPDTATLLFLEQSLNALQFGMMLFMITAGLTLVFGIMDLVNLAHGSQFMFGAFIAAWVAGETGNFYLAVVVAIVLTMALGFLMEVTVLRHFYKRHHLDQVLVTFGFILILNEVARALWGAQGLSLALPDALNRSVPLLPGLDYSLYRFVFIVCGIVVSIFLYVLIVKTRVGMLIRAGASDRDMVRGLGVNIGLLFTFVFGLGAALAGLSGALAAPIMSATIGMGEPILIIAFVVIVLGGVGNVKGAFWAALLIGFIDTLGRSYMAAIISFLAGDSVSAALAPSLSGMLIYLLMACVLVVRPEGLFARRAG